MTPEDALTKLAKAIQERLAKAANDLRWRTVERDAARDVCADLRAEIDRLNAKIKRREADLRVRFGREPVSTLLPHAQQDHAMLLESAYDSAHCKVRGLRDRGYARLCLRNARALRLSDPTFAGRLP